MLSVWVPWAFVTSSFLFAQFGAGTHSPVEIKLGMRGLSAPALAINATGQHLHITGYPQGQSVPRATIIIVMFDARQLQTKHWPGSSNELDQQFENQHDDIYVQNRVPCLGKI
jgi:hypothetical protein